MQAAAAISSARYLDLAELMAAQVDLDAARNLRSEGMCGALMEPPSLRGARGMGKLPDGIGGGLQDEVGDNYGRLIEAVRLREVSEDLGCFGAKRWVCIA